MKKLMTLQTFGIILFSLLIMSCAASKTSKTSYAGDWKYTFPMQNGGEMAVTMTIIQNDKVYSGSLSSEAGSVDLEDLVIEDGKMTSKFNVQGYEMNIKGIFSGDTFTGTTTVDGNDVPMNATRVKEQ